MVEQPVYQKIFEYMLEHYEFKAPDNPLTRFYKWDIAENQYYNLDGPMNYREDLIEIRFKHELPVTNLHFGSAREEDASNFTSDRVVLSSHPDESIDLIMALRSRMKKISKEIL